MNNRVGNKAYGTGTSYGIRLVVGDNIIVKNNTISKMEYGIGWDYAHGLYRENLASGCTMCFSGPGTSAGDNYSN